MSAALAVVPWMWAVEAAPRGPFLTPEARPSVLPVLAPRLEFYRKYTEGMLRRYMRFAMEAGRVPSMMGKEMFRGHVTCYRVHSFEDLVIFVTDVEKCMARLERMDQLLITRIAVQEYTHEETAEMMGVNRRTLVRRYAAAVDRLTAIFLEVRLLEPLKACQGGGLTNNPQLACFVLVAARYNFAH